MREFWLNLPWCSNDASIRDNWEKTLDYIRERKDSLKITEVDNMIYQFSDRKVNTRMWIDLLQKYTLDTEVIGDEKFDGEYINSNILPKMFGLILDSTYIMPKPIQCYMLDAKLSAVNIRLRQIEAALLLAMGFLCILNNYPDFCLIGMYKNQDIRTLHSYLCYFDTLDIDSNYIIVYGKYNIHYQINEHSEENLENVKYADTIHLGSESMISSDCRIQLFPVIEDIIREDGKQTPNIGEITITCRPEIRLVKLLFPGKLYPIEYITVLGAITICRHSGIGSSIRIEYDDTEAKYAEMSYGNVAFPLSVLMPIYHKQPHHTDVFSGNMQLIGVCLDNVFRGSCDVAAGILDATHINNSLVEELHALQLIFACMTSKTSKKLVYYPIHAAAERSFSEFVEFLERFKIKPLDLIKLYGQALNKHRAAAGPNGLQFSIFEAMQRDYKPVLAATSNLAKK
ncbi:poly (ADP-ribose) glycohydrolase [Faustovirus]|nr:poly (ADP-ribose) glycohydrolase [Faustovirus]